MSVCCWNFVDSVKKSVENVKEHESNRHWGKIHCWIVIQWAFRFICIFSIECGCNAQFVVRSIFSVSWHAAFCFVQIHTLSPSLFPCIFSFPCDFSFSLCRQGRVYFSFCRIRSLCLFLAVCFLFLSLFSQCIAKKWLLMTNNVTAALDE